jgi:hypothetical protein
MSEIERSKQEVVMLNKAGVAFVAALVALPHACLAADEPSSACVDVSAPKSAIMARHGRWIELTSAQWQFLRGVYVVNPNTPPGLPHGDKAVLAQVEGKPGGLVFFIDGKMACTPMEIPHSQIRIATTIRSDGLFGFRSLGRGLDQATGPAPQSPPIRYHDLPAERLGTSLRALLGTQLKHPSDNGRTVVNLTIDFSPPAGFCLYAGSRRRRRIAERGAACMKDPAVPTTSRIHSSIRV